MTPPEASKLADRIEVCIEKKIYDVGLSGEEKCLVVAALRTQPGKPDREEVSGWMIRHSYATGHGDTLDDLLGELVHQVHANALLEAHKIAVAADDGAGS